MSDISNRTTHIRHQCRKTTVLSCHRCLINTDFEINELHLNIDYNFDHQMSLSKSKCWYSNNSLHFLMHGVPLSEKYFSTKIFDHFNSPALVAWKLPRLDLIVKKTKKILMEKRNIFWRKKWKIKNLKCFRRWERSFSATISS